MKFPLVITSIFLALPTVIFAQDKVYSPLVDLSNAGQGNDVQSFEQYINFLYGMSIAVAALLAVIKIIIAGAKYMMSDVIGNKEGAKNDIQGAVLGLLLIISAVVILELINPTLIKKEIKFDPLQSPRGELNALAVQTVGGQTVEQHASALSQGLDACVVMSPAKTSASGKFTIVVANANNCSDQAAPQLSLFAKNCEASGGKASQQGNIGMNICATPIDGAEDAVGLMNSIANGQIINTTTTVGAAFVKQNGTIVTTDVNGACDNNVKNLPEGQKKGQYSVCMTNLLGRIESVCEDKYGKYNGSNTSAVTCQMPKSVKGISELTEAFATYKAADPSRKYDTIDNLTLSQERELCEKYAKGTFYDNIGTSNSCIFY